MHLPWIPPAQHPRDDDHTKEPRELRPVLLILRSRMSKGSDNNIKIRTAIREREYRWTTEGKRLTLAWKEASRMHFRSSSTIEPYHGTSSWSLLLQRLWGSLVPSERLLRLNVRSISSRVSILPPLGDLRASWRALPRDHEEWPLTIWGMPGHIWSGLTGRG